ncbi:MAG: HAD family phosphatase [Desulfobulbaceae bacterium]|nr:MAG: HAD family phosphatase [Desulfobulbaceae bacterium]
MHDPQFLHINLLMLAREEMKNKSNKSVKALLFDLGGVLVDIDFNRAFNNWSNNTESSAEIIKSKFRFDSFYKSHEIGEINSGEYFDSLRKSLDIDITDQQFEDGWNSIFISEVYGISRLLRVLKKKIPMYVFSNTNNLHQRYWLNEYQSILSNFETIFTSSDLRKRKPDPEAFLSVADIIGIKPNQILFFDDLLENIHGAKKVGFKTVQVHTILDIERGIKQFVDLN